MTTWSLEFAFWKFTDPKLSLSDRSPYEFGKQRSNVVIIAIQLNTQIVGKVFFECVILILYQINNQVFHFYNTLLLIGSSFSRCYED